MRFGSYTVRLVYELGYPISLFLEPKCREWIEELILVALFQSTFLNASKIKLIFSRAWPITFKEILISSIVPTFSRPFPFQYLDLKFHGALLTVFSNGDLRTVTGRNTYQGRATVDRPVFYSFKSKRIAVSGFDSGGLTRRRSQVVHDLFLHNFVWFHHLFLLLRRVFLFRFHLCLEHSFTVIFQCIGYGQYAPQPHLRFPMETRPKCIAVSALNNWRNSTTNDLTDSSNVPILLPTHPNIHPPTVAWLITLLAPLEYRKVVPLIELRKLEKQIVYYSSVS